MLKEYFRELVRANIEDFQMISKAISEGIKALPDLFKPIIIQPVQDYEPSSIANEQQAQTAHIIADNFEKLLNEFELLRHKMYDAKTKMKTTPEQDCLHYLYHRDKNPQYVQILRNYANGKPISINHIGCYLQIRTREMREILAPYYPDFLEKLDRFTDDNVGGLAALSIQGMARRMNVAELTHDVYERVYIRFCHLKYDELGL